MFLLKHIAVEKVAQDPGKSITVAIITNGFLFESPSQNMLPLQTIFKGRRASSNQP